MFRQLRHSILSRLNANTYASLKCPKTVQTVAKYSIFIEIYSSLFLSNRQFPLLPLYQPAFILFVSVLTPVPLLRHFNIQNNYETTWRHRTILQTWSTFQDNLIQQIKQRSNLLCNIKVRSAIRFEKKIFQNNIALEYMSLTYFWTIFARKKGVDPINAVICVDVNAK